MKVFLIDDDHLSVFLTKTLLTLEGMAGDIRTFLSATEALEALEAGGLEEFPDIIFLDLNMPNMNGWEFLDALTQSNLKPDKKCSIYILTSSLDTSDTIRVEDYVMVSGFIHKPITSQDIEMVLDEHLSQDKSITYN